MIDGNELGRSATGVAANDNCVAERCAALADVAERTAEPDTEGPPGRNLAIDRRPKGLCANCD